MRKVTVQKVVFLVSSLLLLLFFIRKERRVLSPSHPVVLRVTAVIQHLISSTTTEDEDILLIDPYSAQAPWRTGRDVAPCFMDSGSDSPCPTTAPGPAELHHLPSFLACGEVRGFPIGLHYRSVMLLSPGSSSSWTCEMRIFQNIFASVLTDGGDFLVMSESLRPLEWWASMVVCGAHVPRVAPQVAL